LDATAWCRGCNFKPSIESAVADGRRRLDELDDQLDLLNESWSTFLAKALDDPTAANGLALLDSTAADAVRKATQSTVVPAPETISDMSKVLEGLQKVGIPAEDLLAALRAGGPGTAADLEARFTGALNKATAGKNQSTVRLVIE
jgi:hypothetical protein